MRAYLFDNVPGDQRLPHDSGHEVSSADLSKLGILNYHFLSTSSVDALARERNYKNRDEITVSPSSLGSDYESKVHMFFDEHLHEDEEIRYILDGAGFFDIRNQDDEWVRIRLEKYDLMIIPAGIYHRFTTDQADHTKAMRLFQDEPKWAALRRVDEATEGNKHRVMYLEKRERLQRGEDVDV